jgi:hypothetical protein
MRVIKMRIRVNVLLLVLLCILCGCRVLPDGVQPKPSETSPALEMGYDYVLLPEIIAFSGEPMTFTYTIKNLSTPIELGVMLFLDGIAQNFSVDDEMAPAFTHKYALQGNQEKRITFQVSPSGDKGEHKLTVVAMLNPSFVIDMSNPRSSFGNNHKITAASSTIVFEKDFGKVNIPIFSDFALSKISDDERRLFDIPESNKNALEDITFFYLYQGEDSLAGSKSVWYNEKKSLYVKMRGLGGPSAQYRITVFHNHIPIPIAGGFDLMEMNLPQGYSAEKEISLDTALFKKNDVLYAIAIPINAENEYDFPVKTASHMLLPH